MSAAKAVFDRPSDHPSGPTAPESPVTRSAAAASAAADKCRDRVHVTRRIPNIPVRYSCATSYRVGSSIDGWYSQRLPSRVWPSSWSSASSTATCRTFWNDAAAISSSSSWDAIRRYRKWLGALASSVDWPHIFFLVLSLSLSPVRTGVCLLHAESAKLHRTFLKYYKLLSNRPKNLRPTRFEKQRRRIRSSALFLCFCFSEVMRRTAVSSAVGST